MCSNLGYKWFGSMIDITMCVKSKKEKAIYICIIKNFGVYLRHEGKDHKGSYCFLEAKEVLAIVL